MQNPQKLSSTPLVIESAKSTYIEESKIKKFVGTLIASIHKKNYKKLCLIAWDNDESTRAIAEIFVVAFSEQIQKKCALIVSEGIRFHFENHNAYDLVTIPEITAPGLTENIDHYLEQVQENYPFQIIAGPSINNLKDSSSNAALFALKSDVFIFLSPEQGLPRMAATKIKSLTKEHKLNWHGIVEVSMINKL